VLGYIFEKYINAIQPGEQKAQGAYYTKEDITEYISKNTVVPFLFDAARPKCKIAFENPNGPTIWDLLAGNPDKYIYPAVRHGISWDVYANRGKGAPLDKARLLPDDIACGINDLSKRTNWNKPAPRECALPTEIWREVVERRQRYQEIRNKLARGEVRDVNDFITLNLDIRQFTQDVIENCEGPELLRAFWRAIESVTILDPACGSGAFLFAAVNILEPLYEACLDRMTAFVEELNRSIEKHRPEKFADFRKMLERIAGHPSRQYFVFKTIMLNNLFGVDIMEEATEICKLRLFLKLISQINNVEQIEPLPDIDFNIRSGNSLVGYATYEELKVAIGDQLDFENALAKIEDKARILQSAFELFRLQQSELGGTVTSTDKQSLRDKLSELETELNQYLGSDYGKDYRKPADYREWLASHKPFHWFVEFYGIMGSGGFDVIIGNPPYVEYRKVRDAYRLPRNQYASESADNLYAFFMERSCRLLRQSGCFGMIVPTGVLGLDETVSLREVLLERFTDNWCGT
jgi:Eco57I restriction-modification methylase